MHKSVSGNAKVLHSKQTNKPRDKMQFVWNYRTLFGLCIHFNFATVVLFVAQRHSYWRWLATPKNVFIVLSPCRTTHSSKLWKPIIKTMNPWQPHLYTVPWYLLSCKGHPAECKKQLIFAYIALLSFVTFPSTDNGNGSGNDKCTCLRPYLLQYIWQTSIEVWTWTNN